MPETISRADAKRNGLIYFFTGRPCHKGHVATRYAKSGNCVACAEERTAWRVTSGSARRVQAAYNQRHSARHREGSRAYYWRNREQERLKKKAAYRAHVERRRAEGREQSRRWAKENPGKARAKGHRRRARKISAVGDFTADDLLRLMTLQGGHCAACVARLDDGYHIDHIEPLSRGGSNWPENLQLLCPFCNLSKGTKTLDEWIAGRGSQQVLPDNALAQAEGRSD